MRTLERECYDMVRSELSDPTTKLADLDPAVVAVAKDYAKRAHKKWPPKPYDWAQEGGWFFR
jgi:hypothetical protein